MNKIQLRRDGRDHFHQPFVLAPRLVQEKLNYRDDVTAGEDGNTNGRFQSHLRGRLDPGKVLVQCDILYPCRLFRFPNSPRQSHASSEVKILPTLI